MGGKILLVLIGTRQHHPLTLGQSVRGGNGCIICSLSELHICRKLIKVVSEAWMQAPRSKGLMKYIAGRVNYAL